MSGRFIVQIVRGGSSIFQFASPCPFVAPEHSYQFDEANPPKLTSVTKTWTLQGVLYGTQTTAATQWTALKAIVENSNSYPDGIQLLYDATTVDSIIGYAEFKFLKLTSPKSDLQWRGELHFTLVVTGKLLFPIFGTISKLTTKERWSYTEAGLLTQTLEGYLEVSSGSASAAARTQGLKLPGNNFAFVTNGPEGVDVEQLDSADRKANFTSTVQQTGATLPGGVGPSYRRSKKVTRSNGETSSTISVEATGPGAAAAVLAEQPVGADLTDVETEDFGLRARATYTTRKLDSQLLRIHQFTTSGGGAGVGYTERTGNRLPDEHILPLGPVEIVESIRVMVIGVPQLDDFGLPQPLSGLREDRKQFSMTGPYRNKIGRDRSADEWAMDLRRVYRAPEAADLPSTLGEAVFRPQLTAKPSAELGRKGGGSSGGETLVFGGIDGSPTGLF